MTAEQSLLDLLSIQMKCEYLDGYNDGTFQPNKTISRAEVTAIVNRMLDRRADENFVSLHLDDLRWFSDVSRSHWAFYQIVEASNAHNYEKDGTLRAGLNCDKEQID